MGHKIILTGTTGKLGSEVRAGDYNDPESLVLAFKGGRRIVLDIVTVSR